MGLEGRSCLKGSSFSFLVWSCRGIQSLEYVFLVSWANQVTRKTGFLSSSCPQLPGIPAVRQEGRRFTARGVTLPSVGLSSHVELGHFQRRGPLPWACGQECGLLGIRNPILSCWFWIVLNSEGFYTWKVPDDFVAFVDFIESVCGVSGLG